MDRPRWIGSWIGSPKASGHHLGCGLSVEASSAGLGGQTRLEHALLTMRLIRFRCVKSTNSNFDLVKAQKILLEPERDQLDYHTVNDFKTSKL